MAERSQAEYGRRARALHRGDAPAQARARAPDGDRRRRPLAAGAEAVHALRTDLDDHALLARTEVGIFVLTEVLLGEHVDVLERALVDELGRAAHHHVPRLLVLCR